MKKGFKIFTNMKDRKFIFRMSFVCLLFIVCTELLKHISKPVFSNIFIVFCAGDFFRVELVTDL